MVDHAPCENCEILKTQCLQLKEEINVLNQKLDSLLNAVFRSKNDFSCQTPLTSCHSSSTQTETESQLMTTADSLSKSILDVSQISNQYDILMDIFMKSSEPGDKVGGISPNIYALPLIILPFISLPNKPFSNFTLDSLNQDTDFDIKLHNRALCYYGESYYAYNGIRHQPKPLPTSDNHLCLILKHLQSVLPDFQYNSVLLTKYMNGSDSLGFHSDNEPEIVPNSDIVTISLGQSRVAKFRGISTCNDYPEQELTLDHGDVMIMSRKSQDFFQHSITADSSLNTRISITLRMLNVKSSLDNVVFQNPSTPPDLTASCEQLPAEVSHNSMHNHHSEKYTLYIGDSMLKHLDSTKMSSLSQKAIVFAYPGATAGSIISKLKSDPEFLKVDPSKVYKMYVLCGTNSVDKILRIPFPMNSDFIDNEVFQTSEIDLHHAKSELTHLADFLHGWAKSSSLNFINILPRESSIRNEVINCLNHHIMKLTYGKPFLSMISTELHRNLFTSRHGYRKSDYFTNQGLDNVHLNGSGIVRLAKYLKYFAHH